MHFAGAKGPLGESAWQALTQGWSEKKGAYNRVVITGPIQSGTGSKAREHQRCESRQPRARALGLRFEGIAGLKGRNTLMCAAPLGLGSLCEANPGLSPWADDFRTVGARRLSFTFHHDQSSPTEAFRHHGEIFCPGRAIAVRKAWLARERCFELHRAGRCAVERGLGQPE